MSKKDIEPIVSGAGLITGLITDLMTGVRVHGGSAEDIHRLVTPEGRMLMDDICKQIANHGKPAAVEALNLSSISLTLERDFSKERSGYDLKLLRNNQNNPILAFEKLKLERLHKRGESSIRMDEFVHRADWVGLELGQLHAEWILRNQSLIPQEWRGYHLVFCGTLWRDRLENNYVPCLIWDSGGKLFLAFVPHRDMVGRKYLALRLLK